MSFFETAVDAVIGLGARRAEANVAHDIQSRIAWEIATQAEIEQLDATRNAPDRNAVAGIGQVCAKGSVEIDLQFPVAEVD